MGYILKYAVIYESYEGAFPSTNDWECDIPEFIYDSEEEALEFIKDMEEDEDEKAMAYFNSLSEEEQRAILDEIAQEKE